EKYVHSYPHCWRCDTPLLNYATSSWFVSVTKFKDELLKTNQQTSWIPDHMKEGRFGKWLENARDWAISRNRYWGAPLPVWKSEEGETLVVGSVAELEKLTGEKVSDLHKHVVDTLSFEKDGKKYHRIPEVLDCWFESGSMPYGQMHYPFENKETFEQGFPAEFIAEGQDQTRGCFYTLHVLATALTQGSEPSIPKNKPTPAFKHVVVNGIVLAEDGKKMSKRLKNYPDLMTIVDTYGADAVRSYILTSPVVHAENLHFSESAVRETYNKYVNTLWNCFVFARDSQVKSSEKKASTKHSQNMLDRWILSRLADLAHTVTKHLDEYKIADAFRPIQEFIGDLSQWYVRRSRDRMKSEDEDERTECLETFNFVLCNLSKLIAPCTPFIAEMIYQGLGEWKGKKVSVHLEEWPELSAKLRDAQLESDMDRVRSLVESAHALRSESKMKVRQPLSTLEYLGETLHADLHVLIADEVNVKEVHNVKKLSVGDGWYRKEDTSDGVALNAVMSDELKQEGLLRELVRQINAQRKELGLTRNDAIDIVFQTQDPELIAMIALHADHLKKSVLAQSVQQGEVTDAPQLTIDGKHIRVALHKK
ncbi:MAG: class I tRNA ligase family protein, partial [bacterium]|nr:class I tRNA ligase family protein [bacterium]